LIDFENESMQQETTDALGFSRIKNAPQSRTWLEIATKAGCRARPDLSK
jgi:hypothetical protein